MIFVDDGSTDETPARLDALAAEHPHVHVKHIENSGWPGRPRNLGIEMAQGEYVYFVDNDDWIGKDALRRLHARAERDEADIVIGKVVGEGKFVARSVFKRDRRDVTLEWAPLVRLLTPHKLFRKSLLDEHGIRFPEGRRRLEDHVFTMHAYFHARGISVLAGYPCYHWVLREDDANASYAEFEPVGYYGNVREVLDLIDEHMEPGAAARPRALALVPRQDARPRRRPQLHGARPGPPAPALRGDPPARARALRRRGRRLPRLQRPRALAAAARRRLRRRSRRSRRSRPGCAPRRRSSSSSPTRRASRSRSSRASWADAGPLAFERDGERLLLGAARRARRPARRRTRATSTATMERNYADVLIALHPRRHRVPAAHGAPRRASSRSTGARTRDAGAHVAGAHGAARRGRQGEAAARRVDRRRHGRRRGLHAPGRAGAVRPLAAPGRRSSSRVTGDGRRRPAAAARRGRAALPARHAGVQAGAGRDAPASELAPAAPPTAGRSPRSCTAARSRPRRRPCAGAAPRPRRSRGSRRRAPSTSCGGTSSPLRWSSTMSAGPGRAVERHDAHALAHRLQQDQREALEARGEHEHRRLRHVGADVLRRALERHRALEAVLARSAPPAARAARPLPRSRSRQSGWTRRGLGPRRDQQVEALLVAQAARPRRPSWPTRSAFGAGQRPHGVRDPVERQRRRRAGAGRPRGPARSAPRARRGRGSARASTCAAARRACSGSSARARSRAGPARRGARDRRVDARPRADRKPGAPAQPARELDVRPQVEAGHRAVGSGISTLGTRDRPRAAAARARGVHGAGRRAPSPARRRGTRRRTARRGRGRR